VHFHGKGLSHIIPKYTSVLLLTLLYMVLSPPVAWPLYSWVLFRPDHRILDVSQQVQQIEQSSTATQHDIVFPSRNGKWLHGWLFELPNTKRVFLVSEGKGGNIYHRLNQARTLLKCGGSVFQYDYEGYGQSQGTPSLDAVCDDATAAYDYLIQHEHKTSKDIIAFGDSFGCGVTGQLVQRRQVSAVILQSGFSTLLRAGRDTLPWLWLYPDSFFPDQTMDNIAVFSKPHPPLMIIHGTSDRIVQFHNAQELFRRAIEPKTIMIVPGGDHGCFGTGNQFRDAVEKLLSTPIRNVVTRLGLRTRQAAHTMQTLQSS